MIFAAAAAAAAADETTASAPKRQKSRRHPDADERFYFFLSLPVRRILSQKAFCDLPTKLVARHQYLPASCSVTLDSLSECRASARQLTTLCKQWRGGDTHVQVHRQCVLANAMLC